MTLDSQAVIDAVASHALSLGLFERVNAHEPKARPGSGLTAAVWVARIAPEARASGLAVTSARLTLNLRVYLPMLQEPQDAIDPAMVGAVDKLLNAYTGDFTLGDLVRNVDLLGLGAEAGYLEHSGTMMRVMTITLPLIVNDAWEQVP